MPFSTILDALVESRPARLRKSYVDRLSCTAVSSALSGSSSVRRTDATSKFPLYSRPESSRLAQCKCPFWLNGTDCALVVGPAALPKRKAGFDVWMR